MIYKYYYLLFKKFILCKEFCRYVCAINSYQLDNLVCEDGDNLIPTHRVEDNDIVEHYVNAKYSMSEDGIGVCETIFT